MRLGAETIALTSVLVAVEQVLKYVFLIAEFVTQLQRQGFATKTPRSPARSASAPLCYIYLLRLTSLLSAPVLR